MTQEEQAIEEIALFLLYPVGDTKKTSFDCKEWNYAYDIAQRLHTKLESLGMVFKDEILKPDWVIKPDSEGWWWFEDDETKEVFGCFYMLSDDGFTNRIWDKGGGFCWSRKGTWQKALVPEKE